MSLKTDYKDDKFAGMRKYSLINNADGTISLDDVTAYVEEGDVFSAGDINATNKAINDIDTDNQESFNNVMNEIMGLKNSDTALSNRITDNANKLQSFRSETVLSFTAPGWSSSPPYTQTVAYPGIVSSDIPIYGLRLTGTLNSANVEAQKLAWGYVDRIVSGNNSVTAYCYTKKPATTISLSGRLVK